MADLATAAAEAYLSGWALTEGPFTDRVRAGCTAAMGLALEQPDNPGVLEVSLHLGHLEGTWATVYQRREDQAARHVKAVVAAWRELVAKLDTRHLITLYRMELVLGEADDQAQATPTPKQRKAAVAALLLWLADILTDPGYADLAAVIVTAMAEAVAEGKTSTLAVAADQASARGFDWDKAYAAMRAAVTVADTAGAAGTVTQAIMRAVAADTGRALATLAADGASDDDMATALAGDLEDEDAPALAVDTAVSGYWGQGAVALAAAEGIMLDWLTAGDGRVCFPAGTPVMTPDGEQPIESLAEGGLVLTPQGNLAVHWAGSRPYAGGLTILTAEGRTVTATDDHPFSTPRGWREIGQLEPGDVVHTAENECAEVTSTVHVVFGKPDDVPAGARQLRVSLDVASCSDTVPVLAVGLDGEEVSGNGKVDRPPADSVFLLELNPEQFKRYPDPGLKFSLPVEAAIAGDGTELPVRVAGESPEFLRAVPTINHYGRTPAFLGTVLSVEMLLSPESLAAASAVNVLGAGSLACDRAGVVPVGDGPLGDREVFAADRAVLRDRVGPAGIVTAAGTELSVDVSAAARVEDGTAPFAPPVCMLHRADVIAGPRAEDAGHRYASVPHELFAAVGAFIAERHDGSRADLYVTGIDGIPVYDIEVEKAHVFYASGFLVHNCVVCQDNEDNGPYEPAAFPPLPEHVRCRCTSAPASPMRFTTFSDFLVPAAA